MNKLLGANVNRISASYVENAYLRPNGLSIAQLAPGSVVMKFYVEVSPASKAADFHVGRRRRRGELTPSQY